MRSSTESMPNVTPLVDVMLVLLIIFMVVAPALLDGCHAQPPTAVNFRDHPIDSGDVTLGIDIAGAYYLNKQPIDPASLPERLRTLYTDDRPDRVLYIKADQNLDYSKVLAAVDVARNSGVRVLGMIGTPPAAGPR